MPSNCCILIQIRWAYPLVMLVVIYKLKLTNIIYGTALSLKWYGNTSVGKTCCWLDEMCYQLHLNTRVNKVLLQSFLRSSRLTYGQENNHDIYFMYSGYLCIEPCMLAHGYVRWAYPRKELQPLGEILSSTTTYYIWMAQCSLVFHQLN